MSVDAPTPPNHLYDVSRNVLLKLRDLPLLKQLTDDDFKQVTELLRAQRISRGSLLIEQGGTNTNLYILRRGRAAIRQVDLQDIEHLLGFINVGTIFNEAGFLTGARNRQTVEALEEMSLWYIAREDFRKLLEENPDMESRLSYPELPDLPAPNLVREERQFAWQRPGEVIVLFRKKHPWVFIRTLWPLLFGLLIVGFLLVPFINVLVHVLVVPILIGLAAIFVPYFLLHWIDWQNDYYAITDQRVIHRERVLFIRDEQDELPISKIQDVKINYPTFMSELFIFGDVTIEATGARSRVRFQDIGKPSEVSEAIFNQLKRTRVESHASQRAKIRADLRRELGLGSGAAVGGPGPAAKAGAGGALLFRKRVQQYRASLSSLRNTVLPRMRLVQGETIIYRKHWLRLIQTIALPLILLIAFLLVLLLIVVTGHDLAALLARFPAVLLPAAVALLLFGWLVYRYEDWRNDIYMVTSDRIVDIDRSPFGLFGGTRNEAKISAIQNVKTRTHGALDMAFNMGEVVIETGGGQGEFVFERVYDPRRVQRDIMDRMDAAEAAAREKQAVQRRQEMTEWLGIYDELTRLHDRRKLG